MHFVGLNFNAANGTPSDTPYTPLSRENLYSSPPPSITAAYTTRPMTPSSTVPGQYRPITRGYHAAVVAKVRGRDAMLVWGGLHDQAPTTHLESYDFETDTWSQGMCSVTNHSAIDMYF